MLDFSKINPDGTFPVNQAYKEILKLREMLVTTKITHAVARRADGWQIGYPELPPHGNCICSVIQHFGSYGKDNDLLEIMGLLTPEEEENDSVLGWLTAEDVFGRIKAHWEAQNDAGTE